MFYFNDSDHLSNATIGQDDLFDLLEQMLPLSAKWKAIGVGLRLPLDGLEAIEFGYGSPMECMTGVLTLWLRMKYNVERFGLPSWRMVLNVVAHPAAGDNPDLALEIAKKTPR